MCQKMSTNGLFVTDEDVKYILERNLKTSDYKLVQWDLQQPQTKIGLLGDHAFLTIHVTVGSNCNVQQLHFFLKHYPHAKDAAEFAEESGAFAKEIFINKNIFHTLDYGLLYKCVPKCYLAKEKHMLIFEDLTKQGFEVLHKADYDFDNLLNVLKSLARLHACSLIYEERKSEEFNKPYRLLDEYSDSFQESFYSKENPACYATTKAAFKAVLTEIDYFKYPENLPSGRSFKAVVSKCCNEIFDLVKPSQKYRNVICHGDLWFSNILLKNADNSGSCESKFVDFQMYRYVPPGQDVMSVVFLNSVEEFRNKYLYQLIGLYYTELEKHLKSAELDIGNIIPFSDFLENCEEQKVFAIVQSALYAQIIYLHGDVLTEFFSNEDLCSHAMKEDRSVLVLAHINKNEFYRNSLKDTIQSFWNYCQWY